MTSHMFLNLSPTTKSELESEDLRQKEVVLHVHFGLI
jgi:hypothetical protein